MSMFSIFNVSGSAVSAQAQRLNVVASNLANVDAVAGPDGQAYKARQVVFQTTPMGADSSAGVRVAATSTVYGADLLISNATIGKRKSKVLKLDLDRDAKQQLLTPKLIDKVYTSPEGSILTVGGG